MTISGTGSAQDAPTAPGAGLTVREALALPCLGGARLVAGARGDGRRIRVVNIMEVPDIVRWMRGGELLLTTAYAVRDDTDALSALVPVLAERGLAGLGVKVGPYLPELPPDMLAAADELGFPIVKLPGAVMFNDILSEVIGTVLNRQALELERSRAIHERLTRVALSGGSYQELMNVLFELSGCAAAVRDEHGAIVASAGAPPAESPPTAARTIHVDGAPVGSVGLWTTADAGQGDAHQQVALEHATTVAATVAAQERAVTSRQQRYRALMLMELVSRPPRDRAETVRRAAAMGWNPHVPRAAVLVEVHDPSGGAPVTELSLEERLVPLVRGVVGADAVVWGSQSGLAMLVEPGDSLTGRCRAVHAAIAAARPAWDVVVAAGTVREDFADFHHSYEEAVETLTLGREVHGPDFVRGYTELGVYRLLGQLPDSELRRLVDDALGPLLDYDRLNEGSLVETLGAYLLHDRNGVTVAARLHVHYNTLRYRLRQIERLTGGLERHPMSRLQAELAVHARRMLAARDRG
ncbi:PucR family transcriptional regulator [Streptomyces durmitorensis]|uniref:PucR family transcriptional regulator ligand-binding domain-containing protein n=1 Tax=Streptomyces durmitorensis TaxID=319947 RepID=A0ABY4Q543_9ACTN|nr:PucR family transcriptional regulator [Streptomyces durmitorensis]UQT60249.1 PucR family transcriptional regulator ligand-binding domain-containing protein [Streptomyces durmitorensis]